MQSEDSANYVMYKMLFNKEMKEDISLVPRTLSVKIEKGSGNMAIQCLVPEEFNHELMFTYAVKIEEVNLLLIGLCD